MFFFWLPVHQTGIWFYNNLIFFPSNTKYRLVFIGRSFREELPRPTFEIFTIQKLNSIARITVANCFVYTMNYSLQVQFGNKKALVKTGPSVETANGNAA